jgi:hypothetical protein
MWLWGHLEKYGFRMGSTSETHCGNWSVWSLRPRQGQFFEVSLGRIIALISKISLGSTLVPLLILRCCDLDPSLLIDWLI